MVAGLAAEIVAWSLVARGRNVWTTMPPVLGAMGVAALIVGPPAWSEDLPAAASLIAGLGLGVLLYAGTRVGMLVLDRWPAFRRHSVEMYGRQGSLSLAPALLLSIVVSVPGEELFWRGLFQGELGAAFDGRASLAAAVTWAAFLLANLASRNLAIAAGAVVGGAAWGALAWWSGGVLAPLACHIVWTGLMIASPVVRAPQRSPA